MYDEGKGLRDRAQECPVLAVGIRNVEDRALLDEIADELDQEASKIEAEQELKEPPTSPSARKAD